MKKAAFFIVPICFAVCLPLFLNGITQEKLKEKVIDIHNDLEMLSLIPSIEVVTLGIQYMDDLPHVFAALYDENLSLLLDRHPEEGTAPFDPRKNEQFMELVGNNAGGTLPVVWQDLEGGITKRTMYTCFRWVVMPDGGNCLMAAGVSSYSLVSPTLNAFIGIVMTILIMSLLLLLLYVISMVQDIGTRFEETNK